MGIFKKTKKDVISFIFFLLTFIGGGIIIGSGNYISNKNNDTAFISCFSNCFKNKKKGFVEFDASLEADTTKVDEAAEKIIKEVDKSKEKALEGLNKSSKKKEEIQSSLNQAVDNMQENMNSSLNQFDQFKARKTSEMNSSLSEIKAAKESLSNSKIEFKVELESPK